MKRESLATLENCLTRNPIPLENCLTRNPIPCCSLNNKGLAFIGQTESGPTFGPLALPEEAIEQFPLTSGSLLEYVVDFFAEEDGYGVLLRADGRDRPTRLLRISPSGTILSEISLGVLTQNYSEKLSHIRGGCGVDDILLEQPHATHFTVELQQEEPAGERHIELARVRTTGDLIDVPIALSVPKSDVREMSGRLHMRNDGIAIMWSHGSVIYYFTLLSKEDLPPLSEPLIMTGPIVAADSLALAFQYVTHSINRLGLTTVTCNSAP